MLHCYSAVDSPWMNTVCIMYLYQHQNNTVEKNDEVNKPFGSLASKEPPPVLS